MKHPSVLFVDEISADSSSELPDRGSMMEVRLQAQEDEITLLKSSLADALRRIQLHDQLLPLLKQQLIAGELVQHAMFWLYTVSRFIFPFEKLDIHDTLFWQKRKII